MACTARKAMPRGIRQRRNRWIEIQTTDKFRQNSSDMVLRKSGLTGLVVEAWVLSCFDEKYRQNGTRIVTEPDAPVHSPALFLGQIVAGTALLLHCQLSEQSSGVRLGRRFSAEHWRLIHCHRPSTISGVTNDCTQRLSTVPIGGTTKGAGLDPVGRLFTANLLGQDQRSRTRGGVHLSNIWKRIRCRESVEVLWSKVGRRPADFETGEILVAVYERSVSAGDYDRRREGADAIETRGQVSALRL